MAVSVDLLNKKQVTDEISSSKVNGRSLEEFILIKGAGKNTIKLLPRNIQKMVEDYIGRKTSVDIFLRKK